MKGGSATLMEYERLQLENIKQRGRGLVAAFLLFLSLISFLEYNILRLFLESVLYVEASQAESYLHNVLSTLSRQSVTISQFLCLAHIN